MNEKKSSFAETYVKVQGNWCYLSRAIDRDGNQVDSILSEKRNMDAAKYRLLHMRSNMIRGAKPWEGHKVWHELAVACTKRFFKQAFELVGYTPERVTTDGHDSYPRAIHETLGSDVLHRTNHYLNNRIEQDHRGIKQRYYPMRGFGSVASASPSMKYASSFGSGPL